MLTVYVSGEQGADWLWARMTAASLNGSIVIEGIRGNGYLGDIAMDDIIIRLGACEQFSKQYTNNQQQCIYMHVSCRKFARIK